MRLELTASGATNQRSNQTELYPPDNRTANLTVLLTCCIVAEIAQFVYYLRPFILNLKTFLPYISLLSPGYLLLLRLITASIVSLPIYNRGHHYISLGRADD